MTYRLGVDLGTTYTAAAVARNGRAEMLGLSDRGPVIPSVVCIRADGTVLVGDDAERRAATEPDRVAREFKRRVGDSAPLLVGGTPIGAEALQAELLEHVVRRATSLEDGPPDDIVVTHPANWGPYKRELLVETIREADLDPDAVRTLTEPEAAAIHYASQERVEDGAVVAVYDLGGGTFDAAVLRRSGSGYEILGRPTGIERLGGIDFDEAVFAFVRSQLDLGEVDETEADLDTRASWAALRRECVAAKEALASSTDTDVQVALPGLRTQVRLTRSEFEEMVRPAISRTTDSLVRALESAGVTPAELTSVLLVGGSSRIPLVGREITNALGRPVAVDAHPKYAIAKGAALSEPEHSAVAAPASAAPAGPPAGSFAVPPVPPAAAPPTMVVPTGPTPPSSIDDTAMIPTVSVGAPPEDRQDEQKHERSRRPLFIGAFVVVILAIAAFLLFAGGDDSEPEDVATEETLPESTTSSTESVGSPAGVESVDAGLDLPRTMTFAHVVISVDEAVFSDVDPGRFGATDLDPASDLSDTTHLFVTASMAFESDYPGRGESFDIGHFSLRLADDSVVPAESVSFVSSFALLQGNIDPITLAFPLEPGDLAGAVLVLDDRATEPAEVPLDGTRPDDPYPIVIEMGERVDATIDSNCEGQTTFREVAWDVDAGVDHDVQPVSSIEPRVVAGSRWARITLQTVAADGCGTMNIFEDDYALEIDGLAVFAENSINELLGGGEGIELIAVFPVPVDAESVEMNVGSPGGTRTKVAIPRPDKFP